MTSGGREPARSHRPAVKPGRPAIVQRMLFTVMVLLACVAVIALIVRMVPLGIVALAATLVAGATLLAGVKRKPDRQEGRMKKPKFHRGNSRNLPEDSAAGAPQSFGQRPGPSTVRDEPDTISDEGVSEADPNLAHVPGLMQSQSRTAEQTASSPRWGPPEPTAPLPVGSGPPAVPPYSLPDPPVFAAASAPGKAPWHLPVGAAPTGLAADAARLGDLEVRAASMVGAGHRCQEPAGPRQDAYALGRTPDGQFLVIAVADGVSGSPRSDLGARVAVSAATRELVKMLTSGGMPAINIELLYKVIAGEMLGTGRDRGLPDGDICSILIVTVIPAVPRRDGTRPVWTSWIGDVSLWIQEDELLHRVTGREKTGLDRNTLSAVLPFNPDRAEQLMFNVFPSTRVAVMTDGLSDSLSGISGAAEFFTRQWSSPAPHPAAFLHSLCYDGPGQTDDRTAVVVWCGSDTLPAPVARDGRRT